MSHYFYIMCSPPICNHGGMSYGLEEVICSPLSRVELGTRGPAVSEVILDWGG